ncbi:MAG: hypothetical protein ACYC6G_16570 [Desulfobaccales bacterium]
MNPWEIDRELNEERLCELASIIRDVRHKTLSLYDPDEGDGRWSLGCRIYERTINKLASEAKNSDWLTVHRSDGLYFVIFIDNISLRFYRGKIDEPTKRTLRQKLPEFPNQLAFPFHSVKWFWRIAIETDEDGLVLRVIIAQFAESGISKNQWEIPIPEPITPIMSMEHTQKASVVLEKPSITLKEIADEEEDNNVSKKK